MPEDIEDVQEPELQVEVIPEPDEDKPRMKAGDTRSLDVRDDELGKYGAEVQNRIKKLRFAFHEERRVREQKERDFATASDAARRLYQENVELKRSVQRTEQAVVHQAMSRVDAEILSARQANRNALTAGNADEIVDAGEKLARAVAEKERLNLLRNTDEDRNEPPPQQAQPQQQQPQQDERTRQWFSRNSWWNKPGSEERTALAMGVHNSLSNRGITAQSNPDLYWKTIDERLAKHFPENGNGNSQEDREDAQDRGSSRPLAVAGGTRSNTGAANNAGRTRVIRLSESQVRLARTLGLTPEQYAHQLALEQGVA